jgi:hypothetical protein
VNAAITVASLGLGPAAVLAVYAVRIYVRRVKPRLHRKRTRAVLQRYHEDCEQAPPDRPPPLPAIFRHATTRSP